jgi:protein-disulfide isomerase
VAGLLASPSALGLAGAWLVASLALVGLFPREPIAEASSATVPQAPAPLETIDAVSLAEWHKWLDSQPVKASSLAPSGAVKVRVVKFNDYQCPACRMTYLAYRDIFKKYEASHPGLFTYETKDFPLETECGFGGVHASACEAAVAVRLARAKNKGPELEAWLFDRQESMSKDLVKQGLEQVAQVTNFDAEYAKTLEDVRADARLGQQLGVQGTPSFFLNGIPISNLRPAYFDAAIAYLLSKS